MADGRPGCVAPVLSIEATVFCSEARQSLRGKKDAIQLGLLLWRRSLIPLCLSSWPQLRVFSSLTDFGHGPNIIQRATPIDEMCCVIHSRRGFLLWHRLQRLERKRRARPVPVFVRAYFFLKTALKSNFLTKSTFFYFKVQN